MREFLSQALEILGNDRVGDVLRAVGILVAGFLALRLIRRRVKIDGLHAQQNMILRRVMTTVVLVVTIAWALSELGLDLRMVLGAAGVLTVAIGFAAQTSVSNLISGVFLMIEQPFSVGDVIEVSGTTGEVLSIDSMSVKLRTFQNLLVRIPNETMLKANVTNLTHFPLRRYDMMIGVAYREDIARVRDVLREVAYSNPKCLAEPRPLIIFLGFGDSALQLQFSIWATQANYLEMRTSMHEDVKRAFDEHGIEIPFPQRTVHWVELDDKGGPRPTVPPGDGSDESPGDP